MDRQQKSLILQQIREEKEKIYQKILYQRRQIDQCAPHGTMQNPSKALKHWSKIAELNLMDKELDRQRYEILNQ